MTAEPGQENPFESPNTPDQASDEPSAQAEKDRISWSPPRAVVWAALLMMGAVSLQTSAMIIHHRMNVVILVLAMAVLLPRRIAWVFMLCYLSMLIIIPAVIAILMFFTFVVPNPSGADLPQLGEILLGLLLPAVCYVAAFACLLGRNARAFYFRSKV